MGGRGEDGGTRPLFWALHGMKKIYFIICILLGLLNEVWAQTSVNWSGPPNNVFTTQTNSAQFSPLFGGGSTGGGMVGDTSPVAGSYYFELLYTVWNSNGQTPQPTSIAELATWNDTGLGGTNSTIAGGDRVAAANFAVDVPWSSGTTDSIMLVVWSANLGNNWPAALAFLEAGGGWTGDAFLGLSQTGYITTSTSTLIGSTVFGNVPNTDGLPIGNSTNTQLYLVPTLPRVAVATTNLFVPIGNNAVIGATAFGSPQMSFKWYFNGLALGDGTNVNYSLTDMQTNNAGGYYLVVNSPFGMATSAVVSVSVVYPPSILIPPASQVVAAGSNVSLTVTATGTTSLSYQWYDSEGLIIGATNDELDFLPAQTNNWDNYTVAVANAYGSVTSSVANLTVYQPVSFAYAPRDVITNNGAPAYFTSLANGFPTPTYQWMFNGTNIAGATNSNLMVPQTRSTTLGQYAVTAFNSYSSVTSSVAYLYMYPALINPFNGLVGTWGREADLNVTVVGSGPLIYQWYFNGVAISGANGPTLSFPTLDFSNAGLYSVVASNTFGAVTNVAEQLVVNTADISLGVYAGVTINGAAGYSYTIQYSKDLSNTNGWITATNLTLQGPVEIWNDNSVDLRNPPQRFYRVIPGQ